MSNLIKRIQNVFLPKVIKPTEENKSLTKTENKNYYDYKDFKEIKKEGYSERYQDIKLNVKIRIVDVVRDDIVFIGIGTFNIIRIRKTFVEGFIIAYELESGMIDLKKTTNDSYKFNEKGLAIEKAISIARDFIATLDKLEDTNILFK